MKYFSKSLFIPFLLAIAIGCSHDELAKEVEVQKQKYSPLNADTPEEVAAIANLLGEIEGMEEEVEPGEAIYFDIVREQVGDEPRLENIEIKTFRIFEPFLFVDIDMEDVKLEATYTVDCDLGENSWSEDCTGKISCGKLIAKCLDQGGCAEICNSSSIVFVPKKTIVKLLSTTPIPE